jgi:hypothetical protein
MKAMESLINSLYLDSCPWVSQTNLTEKYIDMARISIVTFAYTVLLAFLYLLSKGWQTLQFQMSRSQATQCLVIMGSAYLCYSAYFLSTDFEEIKRIMKVVMAAFYLGHGFRTFKCLRKSDDKISDFLEEISENNDQGVIV